MPALAKYKIVRDFYYPEGVLGNFFDPQKLRLCSTLERPWNNNKRALEPHILNDSSCIPEGVYIVKKYSSAKWPDVWELTNVKDRSKILIHWANCIDELLGCIAVGQGFLNWVVHPNPKFKGKKFKYWLTSSLLTINRFRRTLPDEFELTITSKNGMPV